MIHFVATDPRVHSKLQMELDSATQAGKLSPIVTFEEAQALLYLQAVIKEALRLFPAGMHFTLRCIKCTLSGLTFAQWVINCLELSHQAAP